MMTRQEKRKHLLTYIQYMFPSLFDLSVYSVCMMVSGMMTSRAIGAVAMGAVSVASPYISIAYAYALIFGVGGATVVSVYRGRGEAETANRIFTMNLAFMSGTMLLFGGAAFLFTERLAVLLGATPENIVYVVEYLRVVALFTLPYGLCYALSMMIKADGHPLLGLVGSVVGSGLTLLLFVFLPYTRLGIRGVALSSALGQLTICLVYLIHFFTRRSTLKFVRFRLRFCELWRIVTIGFPDAISEGSSGIFVLLFNFIVFRKLGEDGIVVFSVINYINLLALQMTLGVTQGMQPLTSFARGRGDLPLADLYRRFARVFAGGIGLSMFAVCMFFPRAVVAQFIPPDNAALFAMGVRALRLFSCFLPLVGVSVVSIGYFSAVEQQRRSQFLSLFRGVFGIAAFAFLLPELIGEAGIWLAPAATEAVTAALSVLFFLKTRAKGTAVQ